MSEQYQAIVSNERQVSISFRGEKVPVGIIPTVPSNVESYHANIAAMKASNGVGLIDGALTNVLGYYSAGDTNPPGYRWDTTSSAPNDGLYVHVANNGSGRFILRNQSQTVRATWAGVRGGEANAAADTAILNTICKVAKQVIIDVPVYLSDRLSINCYLIGEQKGELRQTIRPAAGNNNRALIEFEVGATDCGLINLDIDTLGFVSSLTTRTIDPLWIRSDVKNPLIKNCIIASTGSTVDVKARGVQCQDDGIENLVIEHCEFKELASCIYLRGNLKNTWIRYNDIHDYFDHGIFNVTSILVPETIRIIENFIHNNKPDPTGIRYPIEFGAVTTNQALDVWVISNTIHGIEGEAHAQDAGSGSADSISFHNVTNGKILYNIIRDGGGMGITVSRYSDDILIMGNLCWRCNAAGAFIGNGGRNLQIIANEFVNCVNNYALLVENTENYGGLALRHTGSAPRTSRYIYVANNSCGNKDDHSVANGKDPQEYGIAAQESGIFRLEIGENNYFNNAIADIRVF